MSAVRVSKPLVLMLIFVLDNHIEGKPVSEQRVIAGRQFCEEAQHLFAHAI